MLAPFTSGSRSRLIELSALALLAVGIAACGSSNNPKPDTGVVDAGANDVKADTASDVHADVRVDTKPDLQVIDVGNPLCEGTEPTDDFTDPYVIANFDGSNNAAFSPFGSGGIISGNTYLGTVAEDFTNLDWHLTATVVGDGTAHFGISWGCFPTNGGPQGGCLLDISRFKGISFKIHGYAGPDNAMTLSLGRAQNDPPLANASCGSCTLPAGSDASTDDYCRGPRADFPVSATEKTVTILWTDFAGGSPYASIDPHQVTGILWILHDPPGPPDGGTDASDASDAPADAPTSTVDASDAAMCGADGDVCEAGVPDAGAPETGGDDAGDGGAPGVGYNADIEIDDITLVPF